MDSNDILDPESGVQEEAPAPRPTAPPIESRFLFVDVAAMRAKQLRRGALVRLDDEDFASMRVVPHKPERIAIEEVRRNLVLYDTPATKKAAE
jgi:DNA-directed RNA polymerase subunit K/omega